MQYLQRLPVDFLERPQRRQRQAVIAAERHELRLGQRPGQRLAPAELAERLGHLLQGDAVVHGRDGYVAAVDYLGPVLVRVDAGAGVEAAERRLPAGRVPDGAGPEPRAGPVADGRVKGRADDGDVVQLAGVCEALDVLEMGEGPDPREALIYRRA